MEYHRHKYIESSSVLEKMQGDVRTAFSKIAQKHNYTLVISDARGLLFEQPPDAIDGLQHSTGTIRIDLSTATVAIEHRSGSRHLDARLTKLAIPHTYDDAGVDEGRPATVELNIHLARKHLDNLLEVDHSATRYDLQQLKHAQRLEKRPSKPGSKGRP